LFPKEASGFSARHAKTALTIPFGASQRRQQCRPGPGGRAKGGRHCCYLRCSAGATGTASTGHVLASSNRLATLQSWQPNPSFTRKEDRRGRRSTSWWPLWILCLVERSCIRRLFSSPPGRNRCEFCSGPFDHRHRYPLESLSKRWWWHGPVGAPHRRDERRRHRGTFRGAKV
jgi:hypothetical protein